ncbi:hypothetical protein KVR01_003726 [Diaporthe batatas]|uniref:uncharacterized protein n=1 Tax=Diaporthe batatas TaxID=748121 RepID=UPI001D05175D|nr:uncharacterized protein KVR01_003726 [Diaporthe batatas]KAG8168037.1 hypothetical protein KVR01_003726 [Diaporthe batatas]
MLSVNVRGLRGRAGGTNVSSPLFFFFFVRQFFFIFPSNPVYFFPPLSLLRLMLLPQSLSIRTPSCGRPSHPLFFYPPVSAKRSNTWPWAWRGAPRMTLPHPLSSKSC